jgi:hypothetical protein
MGWRAVERSMNQASPLDDVRIASPCRANWDDMLGDNRVRFCAPCAKNVYNLSALSRDEAEVLLRESEATEAAGTGSLCVRLYRRADGTVLTEDCAVGVRRKRRRLVVFGAVGAGLMAAGSAMELFTASAITAVGTTMGSIAPTPSVASDPPATATATELRRSRRYRCRPHWSQIARAIG